MKSEQALAWVVIAFILFALCSRLAGAASVEIHYQNPGTERAYDVLAVCRASGCVEQAVACAPGATCAATVDLEPGTHSVWLLGGNGIDRTVASNVREVTVAPPPPFDCLASDACRADFDGSGNVTIADFGRFLRVLGATWP